MAARMGDGPHGCQTRFPNEPSSHHYAYGVLAYVVHWDVSRQIAMHTQPRHGRDCGKVRQSVREGARTRAGEAQEEEEE
eukprot:1519422-Rhodomonas_salina.1